MNRGVFMSTEPELVRCYYVRWVDDIVNINVHRQDVNKSDSLGSFQSPSLQSSCQRKDIAQTDIKLFDMAKNVYTSLGVKLKDKDTTDFAGMDVEFTKTGLVELRAKMQMFGSVDSIKFQNCASFSSRVTKKSVLTSQMIASIDKCISVDPAKARRDSVRQTLKLFILCGFPICFRLSHLRQMRRKAFKRYQDAFIAAESWLMVLKHGAIALNRTQRNVACGTCNGTFASLFNISILCDHCLEPVHATCKKDHNCLSAFGTSLTKNYDVWGYSNKIAGRYHSSLKDEDPHRLGDGKYDKQSKDDGNDDDNKDDLDPPPPPPEYDDAMSHNSTLTTGKILLVLLPHLLLGT